MINYEQDFYSWTQEQAALLRAGRLTDLDVENLIEEIETMGRSEKRELESRLTVLLLHLLKWKYQPERRGKSWNLTIKGQRIEYINVLTDNPGLKSQLETIFKGAYKLALVKASSETGIDEDVFPSTCPWTLAEVTNQAFYPD
ncbi:MAG: DUF29 domain-containing protein [Methylobacter sp.]|nr:MAG: DUF29 domain-containing protein [Methylobacter sp.]